MHRSFDAVWRKLLLMLCAFLMTGCATPTERGHVAKGWAMAMAELNIVPVFPPREDLQVGDVYIVPSRPEDEAKIFAEAGYLPRGLWIHTVKLNEIMSKFYDQRSNYPTTSAPAVFLTETPKVGGDQDGGKDGRRREPLNKVNTGLGDFVQGNLPSSANDVYKVGDNRRLRLVGFPSFMSATFTQGDLSSFFPVDAGGIAASASFTKSDSVTVKVPVAESCALPANLVLRALKQECGDGEAGAPTFTGLDEDAESFNPLSGVMDFVPQKLRYEVKLSKTVINPVTKIETTREFEFNAVRVTVITEVFYARVVDISMHAEEAQGGLLDWMAGPDTKKGTPPENNGVDGDQGQGKNGKPPKAPPLPEGTPDPNKTNTAEETADAVQKRLEASKRDTPGVSMRVVSVSQSSINMRRIYEKPVAIGFRGFDIDVLFDKNGAYKGLRPVGATEGLIPRDSDLEVEPRNDNVEVEPRKRPNLFKKD